jgi:cupin 2 domain-containing protein
MKNLLHNIPDELPGELFETLARGTGIRIERIVSKGHTTPESAWYDQDDNEWVLVLKGAARLAFEDGSAASLGEGDCLEIPAHLKHRVAWTDPARETIWLAVHYPAPAERAEKGKKDG